MLALWLIFVGSCDQFVKLALAARPAGLTTPATSSLSSSPSSSSSESEVLLGAPAPSPTLGGAATVAVSLTQQKHLQASLSTAISAYSNASTATAGNTTIPSTSDPPVVLVPVEKGFMAREPEEWNPPELSKTKAREERALALERDRLVRSRSVAKDTLLNLPVSVPMPDGEELYRGATSLLRNYDSHAEITRGYIQGPPNKTIWDSPDWSDWNSGVSNCCSCSPGSSQPRPKSSSTGQLSSWGLHWSRPGKSPPSHNRTRCHHHQRHSHPSNSKNSCSSASSSSCKHKHLSTSSSSSTCSSPSSSTSSCTGLIGVVNSGSNGANVTSGNGGMLSSIGGKMNAFSEKVLMCASTLGDNPWTNPNNNANSSVISRIIEETKLPPKSSKGNSSQHSKNGKSHSVENDVEVQPCQSSKGSHLTFCIKQDNQSPSSSLVVSNRYDSSELGLSMMSSKPTSKTILHPVGASHSEPCPEGQSQVSNVSIRLPRSDGTGMQTFSTSCENDSLNFSQNSFGGMSERGRSQRQDYKCSVHDDNGNGGVEPLIREQCGDIHCRLEDVCNSDSKDLQHEQQNKLTDQSGCEPLSLS